MWHNKLEGMGVPGPSLGPRQPDPDSSSVDVGGLAAVIHVVEQQSDVGGDKRASPGGTFSTREGAIGAGALENRNSGGGSSNFGGIGTSTIVSATAAHLNPLAVTCPSTPATVTTTAQDSRDIARLIIPWSALKVGDALGNGGFGTVYKGSWRGHKVAIKMLDRSSLSEAAHAALRHEALMMCRLRHPGIAQCYGLVDEDGHHALVMK
jgi:hypothetical protein